MRALDFAITGGGHDTLPFDAEGKLPSCVYPGGYNVVYLDRDREELCAECANELQADPHEVTGWFMHEEGPDAECSCGKKIPNSVD